MVFEIWRGSWVWKWKPAVTGAEYSQGNGMHEKSQVHGSGSCVAACI